MEFNTGEQCLNTTGDVICTRASLVVDLFGLVLIFILYIVYYKRTVNHKTIRTISLVLFASIKTMNTKSCNKIRIDSV